MNYIAEYENALDAKLCDDLIEFFKQSKNKKEGVTFGGLDKNIKNTLDLHFSCEQNNDFIQHADKILFDTTNKYIQEYLFEMNILDTGQTYSDKGYQIQCYTKNEGYYIYHNDELIDINKKEYRMLTYLYYLNDVEEGGETGFHNGKIKIKPKKGKLVLFPASWLFPHCGMMPISDDKYIITGWFYSTIKYKFGM